MTGKRSWSIVPQADNVPFDDDKCNLGVDTVQGAIEAICIEADRNGLHYLKKRVENGCVINMEVRALVDHSICFIKKVSC